MGLIKRNGYNVKGVEIAEAYAKITRLYIELGNHARVYLGISSNRENLNEDKALEEIMFECDIDKDRKIYEQVYVEAKENIFNDWEDDIVLETTKENKEE